MKTFLNKLKKIKSSLVGDKYYVVYRNHDNKIKTYLIGDINLYKSFGNKGEQRDNAGFRAYCFARKSIRSFRHDRIISLAKKWVLNFLIEIFLVGCIILTSYKIYHLKQKQFNAESLNRENEFLKNQLTQNHSEFQERESQLNQTIQNLQSSFDKEQESIKERKLEIQLKEQKLLQEFSDLEKQLS